MDPVPYEIQPKIYALLVTYSEEQLLFNCREMGLERLRFSYLDNMSFVNLMCQEYISLKNLLNFVRKAKWFYKEPTDE